MNEEIPQEVTEIYQEFEDHLAAVKKDDPFNTNIYTEHYFFGWLEHQKHIDGRELIFNKRVIPKKKFRK